MDEARRIDWSGSDGEPTARVRRLRTDELGPDALAAIRRLLDAAFGDDPEERFTEEDWQHALGGLHVILDIEGEIAAHASVVARSLRIADRPIRTGFVEAVAAGPAFRRRGFGTAVMRDVGAYIRDRFEIGALGTGEHGFYERLGWQRWIGPSSVRAPDGERATADDDGYIMVLPTPTSPPLRLDAPISCDWRPGDVW